MSNRAEASYEAVRWPIVGAGVALAGVFVISTMILADPPSGLPDTSGNPADSIVAAWIGAAGGPGVLDSLRAVSFAATRIRYDTLTGRALDVATHEVWVRWRSGVPGVRIESDGPTVMGFDGRAAWARQNGVLVPGDSPLAREALRATHEILRWLESPYALRDSSVQLTYRGMTGRPEAPLSGTEESTRGSQSGQAEFHGVAVAMPVAAGVASEFTYYFNLGDRFPSDVTYVDRGRAVREVLATVERAASMAYFARRDIFSGTGSRLETVLIADFDVDPDVSAIAFEPSAE